MHKSQGDNVNPLHTFGCTPHPRKSGSLWFLRRRSSSPWVKEKCYDEDDMQVDVDVDDDIENDDGNERDDNSSSI